MLANVVFEAQLAASLWPPGACSLSGQTLNIFLYIIKVLVYFSVLCTRYVAARSPTEAGRPVSHSAEPASASANTASSESQPQTRFNIHRTGPT